MPIEGHFLDSLAENEAHHEIGREFIKWCRFPVTIDMLPDLALLTIFDFYMDERNPEKWHTLVHVCRRWRNIIFGSPRRLNLRLCCTAITLARRKLDIWPLLPIVVLSTGFEDWGVDYIIAALKHNDRVCEVELYGISSSKTEEVLAAMLRPFPELIHLELQPSYGRGKTAPVIPAEFLGGSAPRLQSLMLDRISFPGLPNLLLSATHLVHLELYNIPDSGYISPEEVATGFSMLTGLKKLEISFDPFRSHTDQRCPPSSTRILLPALTELWFAGVHGYFEDLVARIDTPLLNMLYITFLTFDTPQLAQFISRIPNAKAHTEAHVQFDDGDVKISLPGTFDEALELEVSCQESERQLPWMAQLCRSSFPQSLIPTVERLYIQIGPGPLNWEDIDDETEDSQWLDFLRPFISVKRLYLFDGFEHLFARAVQGLVGEIVLEVLPALQTLFLLDHGRTVQEVIGPFVAARQLSGHPISVSPWDGESSGD